MRTIGEASRTGDLERERSGRGERGGGESRGEPLPLAGERTGLGSGLLDITPATQQDVSEVRCAAQQSLCGNRLRMAGITVCCKST